MALPSFIYGTAWKEERTEALTRQALDAGFRAIDTANQRRHYVEAQVGAAIRGFVDGGRRGELWLQTKFTHPDGQDHRIPYDRDARPSLQVAQSFASSLEHLGTDYVDSYVLHGPSVARGLSDEDREAWSAIGEILAKGRARLVGVSNVSVEQLALICRLGPHPSVVQNRCFARTGWDAEVRALCRDEGIAYQGFSLLTANRRELASPAMARIAKRAGATVEQVVFAFARAVGMISLTGSSDRRHLDEDLASATLVLDENELATIERISG
jgi:diketogulonate reductase-like aldo/keto reductase